jgi:hypothetical protein
MSVMLQGYVECGVFEMECGEAVLRDSPERLQSCRQISTPGRFRVGSAEHDSMSIDSTPVVKSGWLTWKGELMTHATSNIGVHQRLARSPSAAA